MDAKKPEGQPVAVVAEAPAEKVIEEKAVEVAKANAPNDAPATPVAKNMMEQHGLKSNQVNASGSQGKIVKQDVLDALSGGIDATAIQGWGGSREKREEKMSSLRRTVSRSWVTFRFSDVFSA